jgi:hypothetical protein
VGIGIGDGRKLITRYKVAFHEWREETLKRGVVMSSVSDKQIINSVINK